MKVPVDAVIHLLHEARHATLATHATQLPGYPYATAVPCVVDEGHRPLLCVSALAEHTKNLLADPRASLSVVGPDNGNILAAPRLTLLGEAERFEPAPETIARYLRYLPEAKPYLELDFVFFRLRPKRMRYIAGFGRMDWIEGDAWDAVAALSPREEADMLRRMSLDLPAGVHLLGVDRFGIDYEASGARARQRLPEALSLEALSKAAARIVSRLN